MADIYYDLSLSGVGAGTTSNPYTWNDAINVSNPDGMVYPTHLSLTDYYIKGMKQLAAGSGLALGLGSGSNYRFLPWDLNLYGPWRIGIDGTSSSIAIGNVSGGGNGFVLDGAVLKAGTVGIGESTFYSWVVKRTVALADNIRLLHHPNTASDTNSSVFSGCSFITDSISIQPIFNDNGDQFIDCIFEFANSTLVATSNPNPRVDFTNCVLPSPVTNGIDATVNYSDSQTFWVTMPFPAWNDNVQVHWGQTVLAAGIKYPPEPGNPPYTDYSTGLFGEARTGIGALYFDGFPPQSLSYFADSSIADGTTVASIANVPMIANVIHENAPDTYFDTTAKYDKVFVYYAHEDGRQIKRVVHTLPNMTGEAKWLLPDIRDGIWRKTKIRLFDHEGAELILDRTIIGTGEDTTHAGGQMLLNIS